MSSAIELINLTKKYGDLAAVSGLSLRVETGEIFGFIGPNGAGKTTTIRMMGGVTAPTEGCVVIDGVSMEQDPVGAKKRIGFIPDRPYLYEKLTGMEFLRFTSDLYGIDDGLFAERVRDALGTFSLLDWKDELIESYSHGMKQRLVFASAMIREPRVIIVDEPMVGLDPAGIKRVKDLFRRFARRGAAIFLSTHALEVAEDLCDRIGVISRGRLVALGSLEELRRASKVQENDLEAVFLRLTAEGPGP